MNEIKRQLKLKIGDTTKHQQQVVRKIHERDSNYVKKNKTFFSAVVSVALLVATCLFVFSLKEEPSHITTMDTVPTPVEEGRENTFEVGNRGVTDFVFLLVKIPTNSMSGLL